MSKQCNSCHYCSHNGKCLIKDIYIDEIEYEDCWFYLSNDKIQTELEDYLENGIS